MNKAFLAVTLVCVGSIGCGDTEFGIDGGDPIIGPLTWTASGLTIVGDDCEFFVDEALEFEITIQGSNVIMEDTDPNSSLSASTDSYSAVQDEVLLTGSTMNTRFPPCVVELGDAFSLTLDDPDSSLDENTTVQVTWDHTETDVSDTVGDCAGEWFVDLPCSGEATLTLTQQTE